MHIDSRSFWSRVETSSTPGSCWLWSGPRDRYGYGRIVSKGETLSAHRAAWLLAKRTLPTDGRTILHRCGVRACVRPDHLFAGHHREAARGENHGRARLSADDAREIVRLATVGGMTHHEIADRFHIFKSLVSKILLGERWRSATGIEPISRRTSSSSPLPMNRF